MDAVFGIWVFVVLFGVLCLSRPCRLVRSAEWFLLRPSLQALSKTILPYITYVRVEYDNPDIPGQENGKSNGIHNLHYHR